MDSILFDLRFAARSLRRRPSFTIVAVATIGLSIAAATSIYSIVDGVLFRYLPYRDPSKLVAVWQRKSVFFDSIPYQIVGVLPKGFELVRGRPPAPFFTPAGQTPNDIGRSNHSYTAIGRLEPGVSLARAAGEANQLLEGASDTPPRGIRVLEYRLDQTREVRTPLLVLLGAVALLVLIACVNVATMLLGEGASREQEMAARVALGAGRARLVRQLLTESTVLALLGGALGVVLAFWLTRGLVAIAPSRIPGIQMAHVDGRVLAVSAFVVTLTGVLFGLTPALTLSGTRGSTALRLGGQSQRGRGALQRVLIASELALSVVLLVGAGLVSRSLERLSAVDPGFRSDHLLSVRLALPRAMYRDDERLLTRYDAMLARLGSLPGVVAATAASQLPFDGGTSSSSLVLEGEDTTWRGSPKREAYLYGVSPHDPLTYAGILVSLAIVSVIASSIPAWRAGRSAPAVVLRSE